MQSDVFSKAIANMTEEERIKLAFEATMKGVDLREVVPVLDWTSNVLTEFFERNLKYLNSVGGGSIPNETSEDTHIKREP